MLEVKELGKDYGEFAALESVSFEAHGGEVFGLLGANGAGKTTLLRILATLLAPSRGAASVAGADVLRRPQEVRKLVGLVSGTMGVHDRLTGRETLEYFGALHGLSRPQAQRRIALLTEQLGLERVLDVRAGGFSTGMKQKIVIARALIHDPPVLLLDEATNGLDVLARRQLLDLIHTLRGSGRLLVYSTHVMSEAEELCDRAAVIAGGRCLALGSVSELLTMTQTSNLERAFFALLSPQNPAQAASP